jgi:hypothetical protein
LDVPKKKREKIIRGIMKERDMKEAIFTWMDLKGS